MAITLRAQRPEDLAAVTHSDSPFSEFGPRPTPTAPASPRLDDGGGLTVASDDEQVAGSVSWHWVQWGPTPGSRCPMIGIWLRSEFRGRGIGSAAQAQLARLFFSHTPTNRVEAHTDVENVAEQHALQTAGFQREGLIRGAQWRDGTYRDGYLYAVLRGDLEAKD